jgi:hypothetical protein
LRGLRLRFACESSTIVPMEPALHFAFIDESGNVASSRQNHILVVAALGMDNSRSIARIIRKTQKKYGSSLASGELKAKKSEDALGRFDAYQGIAGSGFYRLGFLSKI